MIIPGNIIRRGSSDPKKGRVTIITFARAQNILLFVLLILPWPALADFSGHVVGVTDGDTITVLHNGKGERVRLNGIDCPEKGQAFGTRAKLFASDLAFGKDVTVKDHGRDKYGRTIGDVILPDGRVFNRELVAAGLAWWYRKHSKDESLGQLDIEAKTAKRGL
jgi:micrococcal nuclease